MFLNFARENRVNVIVIYYFFCLSDACRDRRQDCRQRKADILIGSTAEER